MKRVIDVEELISKIYDPRVIHMDENGRVKREEVIMVINGLAEEGEEQKNEEAYFPFDLSEWEDEDNGGCEENVIDTDDIINEIGADLNGF